MSFVTSKIPLFGPRQVPGLALWLDASDATTVGLSPSTQNVTQWNDKSGNVYNATRIGTGFPTYSSNSIVFTGTQAFGTTLPSLMSNQSGFAIVRYSSAAKINILSLTRSGANLPAGIQQILIIYFYLIIIISIQMVLLALVLLVLVMEIILIWFMFV